MNKAKNYIHAHAALPQLTSEEKDGIRSVLEDYIRRNPFPSPVETPWVARASFLVSRYIPATTVAVFLLLGGTVYAAQGAVPGHLLYPVRTVINEPLEIAFAFGAARKAQVQFELARRRLIDAQTLADAGELDAHRSQMLEDQFNVHAAQAIAFARQADGLGGAGGFATSSLASSSAQASNATGTPNANVHTLVARLQESLVSDHTAFETLKNTHGFGTPDTTAHTASGTTGTSKKPIKPSQVQEKTDTVYTSSSPEIKVAPRTPVELPATSTATTSFLNSAPTSGATHEQSFQDFKSPFSIKHFFKNKSLSFAATNL
jgi:hypothetical protein